MYFLYIIDGIGIVTYGYESGLVKVIKLSSI